MSKGLLIKMLADNGFFDQKLPNSKVSSLTTFFATHQERF
jgi:hypothetical protein